MIYALNNGSDYLRFVEAGNGATLQVPNADLSTFNQTLTIDQVRKLANNIALAFATDNIPTLLVAVGSGLPPIFVNIILGSPTLGWGTTWRGIGVNVPRPDNSIHVTELTKDQAMQLANALNHYAVTWQ